MKSIPDILSPAPRLDTRPNRSAHGFTLTELTVVLGVIAMLALPLWAMTTKDRLAVQQIRCAGNVKQLTRCALMYSSDYGTLPPYSGSGPWIGSFGTYNPSPAQVQVCPSAAPRLPQPTSNIAGTADMAWFSYLGHYSGSYGFNGWTYSAKETAIKYPSRTPVFMDCVWTDLWPSETDAPNHDLYASTGFQNPPAIARCVIARHGGEDPANAPRNFTGGVLPGAINLGLADGHVETVRLEKLWTCYWHNNWNPSLVPWPHPAPN